MQSLSSTLVVSGVLLLVAWNMPTSTFGLCPGLLLFLAVMLWPLFFLRLLGRASTSTRPVDYVIELGKKEKRERKRRKRAPDGDNATWDLFMMDELLGGDDRGGLND